MKPALIIGSTCVDVIINLDHLPKTAENLRPYSQSMALGGCAYNVSHMMRLLKAPHTFITPVGTGTYGDYVEKELTARGIPILVHVPDKDNGCCYCLVEASGERTFLSVHGAEYTFEKSWMEPYPSSDYGLVYICGLEIEEPTGVCLIEYLEGHPDLEVCYAPGPRGVRIPAFKNDRMMKLHPILHINEQEALELSGAGSFTEAAEALFSRTGNTVIITLGEKGTYCREGNGDAYLVSSVPSEHIVDTIGAGDAHIGTILALLTKDIPLRKAIACANGVSRAVVETQGASLPEDRLRNVMKSWEQTEAGKRRKNRDCVSQTIGMKEAACVRKVMGMNMKENMDMSGSVAEKIKQYATELDEISRERRRDFHKYPETAWLEMRTSAIIAKTLTELGYEVLTGRQVCLETARMGVPEKEELSEHARAVLDQGVPKEYLTEDMREGFTGVIGILRCGEGPVVALRFDIDALGLIEEETSKHRPYAEGFSSKNRGMMHACGHDAHGVIGLGTAQVLMKIRDELHGTVKLIFQPGEEGARGARAIVAHGHLDDVDYFVGTHVAPTDGPDDGDVTPGTWGSLATSKYDAHFYGQAAHAGGFPENGKSAIVAAANAVLNLTAISRHSGGSSRVNVGTIHGGTSRNVVPDHAMIQFEVRGETTKINQFMDEEARRICLGAAQMAGCSCEMVLQGGSESQHSDEDFLKWIAEVINRDLPHLRVSSCKNAKNWGSEDISLMMNRVQEHGGKAVYMRSMTPMASAQHTTAFDFDEKVLVDGIETFCVIVWELMGCLTF